MTEQWQWWPGWACCSSHTALLWPTYPHHSIASVTRDRPTLFWWLHTVLSWWQAEHILPMRHTAETGPGLRLWPTFRSPPLSLSLAGSSSWPGPPHPTLHTNLTCRTKLTFLPLANFRIRYLQCRRRCKVSLLAICVQMKLCFRILEFSWLFAYKWKLLLHYLCSCILFIELKI